MPIFYTLQLVTPQRFLNRYFTLSRGIFFILSIFEGLLVLCLRYLDSSLWFNSDIGKWRGTQTSFPCLCPSSRLPAATNCKLQHWNRSLIFQISTMKRLKLQTLEPIPAYWMTAALKKNSENLQSLDNNNTHTIPDNIGNLYMRYTLFCLLCFVRKSIVLNVCLYLRFCS